MKKLLLLLLLSCNTLEDDERQKCISRCEDKHTLCYAALVNNISPSAAFVGCTNYLVTCVEKTCPYHKTSKY